MRAFLGRFPEGMIVTPGAGFDTRPWRLDNGRARWQDLDLPEVAELRRRVLPGDARHLAGAASVLDPAWLQAVPAAGPTLFVIEGLVNYLAEEDARALLGGIAGRFPGAEIVVETLGLLLVRLAGLPEYRWGASAENLPSGWEPGFEPLGCWSVFERHPERWAALPELRFLAAFGRNLEAIPHLRVRTAPR